MACRGNENAAKETCARGPTSVQGAAVGRPAVLCWMLSEDARRARDL